MKSSLGKFFLQEAKSADAIKTKKNYNLREQNLKRKKKSGHSQNNQNN